MLLPMADEQRLTQEERESRRRKFYNWSDPWAFRIKAALQMLVGVLMLVAVLLVLLRAKVPGSQEPPTVGHEGMTHALASIQEDIFGVIGIGLAVGAAIELAYTFFTDGPDEALDPALLTVSSALIVQLGQDPNQDGYTYQDGIATVLLVVALWLLFRIRRKYIHSLPTTEGRIAAPNRDLAKPGDARHDPSD